MLDFVVPRELEAHEPPEARGLKRDEVRLMVSDRSDNRITHAQFKDLAQFLSPGDLIVINTSGTIPAALDATRADGCVYELHLSSRLHDDLWIIEMRSLGKTGAKPFFTLERGEIFKLPGGGAVRIGYPAISSKRLWFATLDLPRPLNDYLARHGFPIRYEYVPKRWDISYYQTVYATEPGSAEMPSAGRAFSAELIAALVARGIKFAPLLLHTGVASLEEFEPPYQEWYLVPADTARAVNLAHKDHQRVVAVGTTVVRALETVTDDRGITRAGEGWTSVVITPQHRLRSVDAMITGMHEPRAKHLEMLSALAGEEHLQIAYDEAVCNKYLWHEFGDLHLIK